LNQADWEISDGTETIPWEAIDGNRYTFYEGPTGEPFPYVEIRLPYETRIYGFSILNEYPFGVPNDDDVDDFLSVNGQGQ